MRLPVGADFEGLRYEKPNSLGSTIIVEEVTETLYLALQASGCDQANVDHM